MPKILRFCGVILACLVATPSFSASNARSANAMTRAATPQPQARETTRNAATTATTARSATSVRSAKPAAVSARSTTVQPITRPVSSSARTGVSRAAMHPQPPAPSPQHLTTRAALAPTVATMGGDYNVCRDAYFTCMDQFCAARDETYRRCACSARLDGLREIERNVKQTQGQLQNFADYNIDAISKTAAEVAASLSATVGESTALADKSESVQKLAGISAVLSGSKSQALSTAGQLDIAGDISAIWATPDFIGGADIANMEGEKLYNQVNSQCLDMVAAACPREATLNMVVSAYGMYIEQDCNTVLATIEGRKTATAAIVRQTGREMDLARLENYNAHNSTEINECIAQVRKDITGDAACGTDYVHCLDVTGLYLDYNTGAPIYSPEFFKLEYQTSLDGDFMNSNGNRLLVARLEENKSAASRGLDTCRDLADDVWAEFKRQAVIEIYQTQQTKVKQVRDECLSVVDQCYDEKIGQLKNFANIDSQRIIGQSIGAADALCQEKLTSCSNMFGGGADGLVALLEFVDDTGSGKIFENCETNLNQYVQDVCAVTSDLTHSYPYNCRIRNPGSYDCEVNGGCVQSGSVYDLLSKYARENCVRADYSADDVLPANVLGVVNKVFDSVWNDMRLALRLECERYSGEWLDSGLKSNNSLYVQLVSASDQWGVCVKPFCVTQGDAYLDSNGVKICCPAGQIANESANGCVTINCPVANSATGTVAAIIDTIACNDSIRVQSTNPPTLGGCIGRVGSGSLATDEQAPYCSCPAGTFSLPHNYNAAKPSGARAIMVGSQGTCQPGCKQNSTWDARCTARGGSNTSGTLDSLSTDGCIQRYCRCNPGYKFRMGTSFNHDTGVLDVDSGFSSQRSAQRTIIARAGGTVIMGERPPDETLLIDACVPNCPENSAPDASCPADPVPSQANCPGGDMLPHPGCVSAGCRCNPGYCVRGGVCIRIQTSG